MTDFNFKKKFTFEDRLEESKKILNKYPDKIPVIVEKSENTDIEDINKHKFLVPSNLTANQLNYVIRKRIKLTPEKSMFIFVGNVLPPTSQTLDTIYNNYKDPDGFLYVTYAGENTFG